MKSILIVEDDRALRDGLTRSLRTDSLKTDCAESVSGAREKLAGEKFDLIVLDCNLPDGSGVDFCAEIQGKGIPVIFLTVLDSELDEVSAFRAGGIDYIKKPFSLMVLKERINAALSRCGGASLTSENGYRFDFDALSFSVDGEELILSPAEQKLLKALTANRRNIVSRSRLIELLWGCDGDFIDENALSVTVKRLRSKLGADCIKTVYGLGYMWTGER